MENTKLDETSKRIQVPAKQGLRNFLRDLSAKTSIKRDREVSVGGVAEELLEALKESPELASQLLDKPNKKLRSN